MSKNTDKSYPQKKKERRRRRKLSPDLPAAVQIVFDYSAQQTLSQAWSNSIRRSRRFPAFSSSDRSFGDSQDDWTENAISGESTCGLRQMTSWRRSTPSTTTLYGTPQNLWYRTWIHQPLEKIIQNQKATVMTDKESDMFEIKKGTKQGDPLSSLLFNTVLQVALADDIPRWQKKKRNGHVFRRLPFRLPHQFAICWRCTPVCDYRGAASKNDVISNIALKRCDRYIKEKRRFSAAKARAVEKKWRLTTSKCEY